MHFDLERAVADGDLTYEEAMGLDAEVTAGDPGLPSAVRQAAAAALSPARAAEIFQDEPMPVGPGVLFPGQDMSSPIASLNPVQGPAFTPIPYNAFTPMEETMAGVQAYDPQTGEPYIDYGSPVDDGGWYLGKKQGRQPGEPYMDFLLRKRVEHGPVSSAAIPIGIGPGGAAAGVVRLLTAGGAATTAAQGAGWLSRISTAIKAITPIAAGVGIGTAIDGNGGGNVALAPGQDPATVVYQEPTSRQVRKGGVIIGNDVIVSEWNTDPTWPHKNGWTFYRLANGRIGTYTRWGVWKTWKPQKHIVVPRNPRIGTLLAADRRIDRLMRGLAKRSKKLKLQH